MTRFANERAADRTVVVIVSALATVEAAVEVVRHGAFDFLVKPFVPADLLAVVERASRQRRLMAERETYLSELNSERTLSRQLIDSLRDGVIVLNVKARPVLMNTRAEYLLGVGFREDLGLDDLGLDGPARAMIEDVLAAHGGGEYHQVRLERGGTVLDIRATPWLRSGEKAGVIVQLGDVTEQARTESDKNRFISMVAHELTSPLAAISSYLAIVLEGTLDGQPERIKEIMGRSKARADALLELVKDLQYLNRREAGRVTRTVERLDIAEVLRGQLEFYRGQAERRAVELRLEVGPGDTTANADRGDLDRVFMNLISNGIKYNREGGTLTVSVDPAAGPGRDPVRGHGHRHERSRAGRPVPGVLPGPQPAHAGHLGHGPRPGHRAPGARRGERPHRRALDAGEGQHLHGDAAALPLTARGSHGSTLWHHSSFCKEE